MSNPAEDGPGADALRTVLIAEIRELSDGVRGLTLTDPEGMPMVAWEPGAHIDLALPSGLVRTYSLCGDPDDLISYQIAVLHEPESRGGSAEVHEQLTAGDTLKVRGPRNHFPLAPAPGYLFVAGGIGITPILPMLAAATAKRIPWRLVYGGRTRGSMAFIDRLAQWSSAVEVLPQNEVGLLDIPRLVQPSAGERVYCCGPAPLLDAVGDHCGAVGISDRLHIERFSAQVPEPSADDQPIEVQLGQDGPVLDVPADRSILSVLLEKGVDVAFSCEEGTCGSCETTVLAGEPDHRDELLTEEEKKRGGMLLCVSRACGSRLVIDVNP